MQEKNILFISYYSHQQRYFNILKEVLKKDYQVYHLDATKCFLKGVFKRKDISLTLKEVKKMIDYSYQQFKISRGAKEDKGLNKLYYKILQKAAKSLYTYYYKFMEEKKIDLVIVWNGHRIQVTPAIAAAEKLNLKKLYLENGFFPKTIVADQKGVNAHNSLANKDKSFYENVEIDYKKLNKLKEKELEQRELRKKGLNKLREKLIREENKKLPNKFIFLPFQVLTDSQILLNSPLIDNMEQLVDVVYEAVEKFNQKNNENYWVVAKEHPSDFGKRDYSDLKERYKNKNITFLTKMSAEDLIELSKAVVTINSTVGIEGLLKSKPVITLGDAFYNVDDIVYHVEDLSFSDQILEKAITPNINQQLIDKFLYYLRYEYLIEADKKNANKDNVGAIVEKIKHVLN